MIRFFQIVAFCLILVSKGLLAHVVMISNRQGFYDADHLSPKRQIRSVCFQAPYMHMWMDLDDWKENIEGKSVALLIHGYNNDYQDAIGYFSKVMQSAKGLYDHFVCYLWPGGDNFFDYLFAESKASGEVLPKRLMSILGDLSGRTEKIDVIAHSMGCKLILEALKNPSEAHLRNVFLMAPAVDNESLEKGEVYASSVKKCKRILVFYSLNDRVVNWAYPIIDWDRALGSAGTETANNLSKKVLLVDSTPYINSHSDYANSEFVFQIISNVVKRAAQ